MIKNLFRSSLMILLLTFGLSGKSFAQELKFFTIGTGGTAYTYYPVGGMIANAISKPPGSRECGKGERKCLESSQGWTSSSIGSKEDGTSGNSQVLGHCG